MRTSRRPAVTILVALIAGVLMTSPGESSARTGNRLPNPGFERGAYAWSVRGGTLKMTRLARYGAYAAVLTRQGTRGHITLDDSAARLASPTPGTRCAASAWVRARPGARVRIRLSEIAGSRPVAIQGATLVLPNAVWHRISTSIEVIGRGHQLDLNIYGIAFPPQGILVVDDVVEACASSTPGPLPASTSGSGDPSRATTSPTPSPAPRAEAVASPSSQPTPSPETTPNSTTSPTPTPTTTPTTTPTPSPTPSTDSPSNAAPSPSPTPNPAPQPASFGETVTVAAAGDIACDPDDARFNGGAGTSTHCRQQATSDLVLQMAPDAVLPLGDNQYEVGSLQAFRRSYDPSWGRFKSITRPAVGNHEYETSGAQGYYQYFGSAAGDPSKGYYSFELGDWHMIVLNTACEAIGGCGVGSPQERWLRQDLQAHPAECTLAVGHEPRWSSGQHGNHSSLDALWRALYDNGADVVLAGHDHNYERFAPQNPSGAADPSRGIREFVVGTGGKSLRPFPGNARRNSERRLSQDFGILRLTLHPDSYAWQYVTLPNAGIQDSGATVCH